MELERLPNQETPQERPTTHWRRKESHNQSQFNDHQKPRTQERPTSRRGMMSRQSSNMEERPYTQQSVTRPLTANRNVRPPSAASFASRSNIPGTASRLASAMMQQPPSRGGTAMGVSGAQVNVLERPITQQGLSGMRTGVRGPQMRQVQDKRYFEGLLQMKIRELSNEVGRLSGEIENQTREQLSFLVYDKRVKEMATELTDLQGQLADYNLLVDKLNTDTEKDEVDTECSELKAENDHETGVLEQLFAQRQQREAQIQQLEKEIEQERHMTDNLVAAMSPALRDRYSELQHKNTQLQNQMEQLQQQLDSLTTKKTVLEDQLSISQMKQEAVRLHHKLYEVEERRDALVEEEKNRATPAQEREQLLQRVKDDNTEMATMERQIAELKETVRKKQEELEQTEQDLDESQSERHQKYRELRRREETMEQFLSTFEENREQEMARLTQLEADIVVALQQMSRNLAHSGHLPSSEDFSAMKDNLTFKEGELEKSKKTVEGLSREQHQLKANLQRVEALEEKIAIEMDTLKQRMTTMTNEMNTLSDLDKLRNEAQEKRSILERERDELLVQKGPAQDALAEMQEKHNLLKKQLNDNETFAQLSNLEKKLALVEQNNFTIKEFIAAKKSETNYEPMTEKVFKLVEQYNKTLQESLKKGGISS